MKKLIFFLIFGLSVLSLKAQNVFYPNLVNNALTWDSIRIPVVDTTVIITGTGNISTFNATLNYKMTGLDSSVIVHPGGSDSKLVANLYKFMNDSFPYTLSRLKWVRTTNGVTHNERSFLIVQPIGHLYLGFYLKNSGCTPTTKYLKYQALFTRP